jgi:hypothetical protein
MVGCPARRCRRDGRVRGLQTAAADVIPDAVAVMDPFHAIALAGATLDLIRQRVQQETLVRRCHTRCPFCPTFREDRPIRN